MGQRGGRGAGAVGAPGGFCHGGHGDKYLRDKRQGGRPRRDAGPAERPGCERSIGQAGQATATVEARSSSALSWDAGLAILQKSRWQVPAGRWAGGEGRWQGRHLPSAEARRHSGSCWACGAPRCRAVLQGESNDRTGRGRPAGRRNGWAVGAARAPGGRRPFLPRSRRPSRAIASGRGVKGRQRCQRRGSVSQRAAGWRT